MPIESLLLVLAFGLLAGVLIGCAGIGGVILVPLLSYVVGIDIRIAIAAAMFAYVISGLVGIVAFARQKTIRWDMMKWMWLGAMPAALAGALAVHVLPATFLELCVGLFTAASGVHALWTRGHEGEGDDQNDGANGQHGLRVHNLAGIGGLTGFFSAMTGTGGPLVLIPILLWVKTPVLTAIGLAIAIQLPIAVPATIGNYVTGLLDIRLGCIIAAGILLGTWLGAHLAHVLPRTLLHTIVSVMLLLVGGFVLLKLAGQLLA